MVTVRHDWHSERRLRTADLRYEHERRSHGQNPKSGKNHRARWANQQYRSELENFVSVFTRVRYKFPSARSVVGLMRWFFYSRSGCWHADKSHGRHVHRYRVRGQRHITRDTHRIAAVDEQQDRHRVRKGVRVSTNMKNGHTNVYNDTIRDARAFRIRGF